MMMYKYVNELISQSKCPLWRWWRISRWFCRMTCYSYMFVRCITHYYSTPDTSMVAFAVNCWENSW